MATLKSYVSSGVASAASYTLAAVPAIVTGTAAVASAAGSAVAGAVSQSGSALKYAGTAAKGAAGAAGSAAAGAASGGGKALKYAVGATVGATGGVGAASAAGTVILKGIGFTAVGPAANSIAATWMSSTAIANGGAVAAGSVYSAVQATAMGGGLLLAAPTVLAVGAGVGAVVGAGYVYKSCL